MDKKECWLQWAIELHEPATEKNTVEQIKMCFEVYKSDNWKTLLD